MPAAAGRPGLQAQIPARRTAAYALAGVPAAVSSLLALAADPTALRDVRALAVFALGQSKLSAADGLAVVAGTVQALEADASGFVQATAAAALGFIGRQQAECSASPDAAVATAEALRALCGALRLAGGAEQANDFVGAGEGRGIAESAVSARQLYPSLRFHGAVCSFVSLPFVR